MSVIIGHTNVDNNWKVDSDKYGNAFILNESIRQKIKIGKNVTDKLDLIDEVKSELTADLGASSYAASCYDIAEHTFISNNNKNMNLSLMNFVSKSEVLNEQHCDDNILYITISNDMYTLIKYDNMDNEIVQTYRKSKKYQGCAITFKYYDCNLFSMYCKNKEIDKFVELRVSVDKAGKVCVKETEIIDKNILKGLKKQCERSENGRHFKVTAESGKLLTSTYVIDSEYVEQVTELVKDIPNSNIIVIEGGSDAFRDDWDDEHKEALDKALTQGIVDNRVRAITCIGLTIPYEYYKKYSLIYVFNYNMETSQLSCVKSN